LAMALLDEYIDSIASHIGVLRNDLEATSHTPKNLLRKTLDSNRRGFFLPTLSFFGTRWILTTTCLVTIST